MSEAYDNNALWFIESWRFDGFPSHYGNPEAALIQGPPLDNAPPTDIEEVKRIMSCLRPIDRKLWVAHWNGIPQNELAHILGISQPSVCQRLRKLRLWAAFALPVRKQFRTYPDPYIARKRDYELWRRIVWHHQSIVETGRLLGVSQATAAAAWDKLKANYFQFEARSEQQAECFHAISDKPYRWSQPREECPIPDAPLAVRSWEQDDTDLW